MRLMGLKIGIWLEPRLALQTIVKYQQKIRGKKQLGTFCNWKVKT